jgi:hypothetical protein
VNEEEGPAHRLVGAQAPKIHQDQPCDVKAASDAARAVRGAVVLQSGPLSLKPRALHGVGISSWLDTSACLFHV